MKMEVFKMKLSNAMAENRLLKMTIIVIGVVTVINSLQLFRALDQQRTVIMPPVMTGKFELRGSEASDEYVRSYAIYALGLAMNYTPTTARWQFEELLTMYDPEAYPEAKRSFYEMASKIESASKVSSMFYISKITTYPETKKIEVMGTRKQYADDKKVEDGPKKYMIEYTMGNGKLLIKKLYEKEGA